MASRILGHEVSIGREPEARGTRDQKLVCNVTGKGAIRGGATAAYRKASILVDALTAFVLMMLGWAALIGYTCFMASRDRRSGVKPKRRRDEESKPSELD